MSLKVVKPITVLPSMLASSVPVDDYPEWSAAATYAADERVVHSYQVWQSLQADNTGKDPAQHATWWVLVGPVNLMRAFDRKHTTKTRFADAAWFEIQLVDPINAFSLIECDGIRSVTVKLEHASYGILYEKTVGMWTTPDESGWYAWAYGERREQSVMHLFDLPTYRNAKLRVEIEAANDAGIGVMLLGQQKDIGFGVMPGLSMGVRDFSRKDRDQWGDVVLQERAYARERSFRVTVEKSQLDNTDRVLTSLRATPALWLLSQKYEQANVYGWVQDWRVSVDYGPYSVLSLQIEGLI